VTKALKAVDGVAVVCVDVPRRPVRVQVPEAPAPTFKWHFERWVHADEALGAIRK
jgi:hypothetical protein